MGEVPEPDDLPEDSEEENTGPVEDQTSDRYEVEIPEPEPDELPEDNDEENIVPAEDETPHYSKKEIQEPDTDELLEQYGKEYGDDETLNWIGGSPIKYYGKSMQSASDDAGGMSL